MYVFIIYLFVMYYYKNPVRDNERKNKRLHFFKFVAEAKVRMSIRFCRCVLSYPYSSMFLSLLVDVFCSGVFIIIYFVRLASFT